MSLSEQPLKNGLEEQTPQSLGGGSTDRKNSSKSPRTAMREALEAAQRAKQARYSDDTGAAGGGDEPDAAPAEPDAPPLQERDAPEDVDADPGDSDTEPTGRTMADVAEQLGLTETELYDSLTINTGDGEPITLGKAKETIRQLQEREQGIATKSDELRSREAGLVTDVQAMGVLHAMQALPQNILAQANGHLQDVAQREYQNFLTLHPDLQEDGNRIAFEKGMDEHLAAYGLTSAHFGVKTVGMYRLIQDVLRDKAELKRLKTPTPKPPPKKLKGSRPGERHDTPKPLNLTGGARSRFAQLGEQMRK